MSKGAVASPPVYILGLPASPPVRIFGLPADPAGAPPWPAVELGLLARFCRLAFAVGWKADTISILKKRPRPRAFYEGFFRENEQKSMFLTFFCQKPARKKSKI